MIFLRFSEIRSAKVQHVEQEPEIKKKRAGRNKNKTKK